MSDPPHETIIEQLPPRSRPKKSAQAVKPVKPLDVRAFCALLYPELRKRRLTGPRIERELRKVRSAKHARRVRLPALPDCNVIDTAHDSRGRTYFELSNGQCVRVDKCFGSARIVHRNDQIVGLETRPSKTRNAAIKRIVAAKLAPAKVSP